MMMLMVMIFVVMPAVVMAIFTVRIYAFGVVGVFEDMNLPKPQQPHDFSIDGICKGPINADGRFLLG